MADRPIGRETELAAIGRELARIDQRPVAVLLEGPAGIGKTTLWAAAVADARTRGVRVLTARPSGTDAGWAYQSLADLLGDATDEILGPLPPPQRRALEVALLRTPPGTATDGEAHAAAVAQGAVSGLLALARERPVLVAIDDGPWLDPATADVLTVAVRRLRDSRVGWLITQRVDGPADAPLGLDASLAVDRHWLAPLTLGALHLLLAERLELTLPRPTLIRLHELAQGNPFHALEIGRALQRLPALPGPGAPLPIPSSLRELILARSRAVPAATRDLLLLIAAAGSATVATLAAAVDDDLAERLDPAVEAGLVAVDGPALRFAHPTIASAVYEAASPAARRRAHATLAGIETGSETRARHLALSTVQPDRTVADALEAGARDAKRRGAIATAAELARLAAERTPADEAAALDRRELLLADCLFEQADLPAAHALLGRLIARMPPGRDRAEARMILGTIAWYLSSSSEAIAPLVAALADAGDDRELRGRLHYRLAVFHDHDLPAAQRHADLAIDLLRGTDAPVTFAAALFTAFLNGVLSGGAPRSELLDEGLAVEGTESNDDQSTVPGIWYHAVDRPDLALARFEQMLEASRTNGETSGEADLLTRIAEALMYADRFDEARRYGDEATITARQEGQATAAPARRILALIDAHAGRLAEARAAGLLGYEQAASTDDFVVAGAYVVVLVAVAVAEGDHAEVVRWSEIGAAHLDRIGMRQPLRLDTRHERIEALAALGRIQDAEDLLAEFEAGARVVPRPWADAAVARGRASIELARGELAAALAATDPATDERSSAWRGFDRARTLLLRGRILRQQRAARAAGETLDGALAIFDRIGARIWADRTRAEIERLGRRRSGSDDLTPTERRVAELAAEGYRNREVAEALGISAKTVEAHLARIYEKLGIRSRAELGRAVVPDRQAPHRPV